MTITEKIRTMAGQFENEDLEILERMLNLCGEYVEKVNRMGNISNVTKYRIEGEEYRDCLGSIDKSRSNVHNDLISHVKMVNRLCERYNLAEVFMGNVDERIEVAEFAMEVVRENFENRKK